MHLARNEVDFNMDEASKRIVHGSFIMKLRDMKQILVYIPLLFTLGSGTMLHAMDGGKGSKAEASEAKSGGWFSGWTSPTPEEVSDEAAWQNYIEDGEAAFRKPERTSGGYASWLTPQAVIDASELVPEVRESVREIRKTVADVREPLIRTMQQATTTMAGIDNRLKALEALEDYIKVTPAAKDAKKAFEEGKFAEHTVKPVMTQINHGVQETLDASFDNAKRKANTFWENYVTTNNLIIAGVVVGSALACYGLYKLGSYWIYNYLNKPKFNYTLIKAHDGHDGRSDQGLSMQDIIFCPEVKDQLNTVLITAASIKEQIIKGDDLATYRNLALYGPRGSGKRLFARQLAEQANMDFYELPGSSLTKYKDGDAAAAVVNFFHAVNNNSNPQGAVIYINNSNLLFTTDQKAHSLEGAATINSLVSAFVEQLEKRSSTYMVILGSSIKPESRGDITRCIDDVVEIKRPDLNERIKGLMLYRNKFLLGGEEVAISFADSVLTYFDEKKIGDIAARLEGATIGDIHDYVKAVRDEVRLEGIITSELLDRVTDRTVEKYKALIH